MKKTGFSSSLAMKFPALACALFFHALAFAQDTLPQRIGENTLTFALERGGTVYYDPTFITINESTELQQYSSYGLSAGYTHSFPVRKRSALVLGAGLNATMFSSHVIYRNPDVTVVNSPNSTTHYHALRSHDLGKVTNAYFAMDFQVLYAMRFPVKNISITPYAGMKFRNVVYIGGEQEYLATGAGIQEIDGPDTIFFIQTDINYRMRDSRIVLMPALGLSIEKPLANGGKFGLFADYSYAIFNTLMVQYRNFHNTEKLEVTQTNGSSSTTSLQVVNITYKNNSPLVLELNMSHIRIGVSYTLPARKR